MRRSLLVIALAVASCQRESPAGDEGKPSDIEDRVRALEDRVRRLEQSARQPAADRAPQSPAAPEPSAAPLSRITIELSAGGLTLNGEAVATVALRAQLEAAIARSPDATVMIRADDAVPHARVVETMDEVKKAGIDKIATVNWSDD